MANKLNKSITPDQKIVMIQEKKIILTYLTYNFNVDIL